MLSASSSPAAAPAGPPVADRSWCAALPQPVGSLQEEVFALWAQGRFDSSARAAAQKKDRIIRIHDLAGPTPASVVLDDFSNWLIACCDKGARICLDLAAQPSAPSFYTSSIDSISSALQDLVAFAPLAPLSRDIYRRYAAWISGITPENTLPISLIFDATDAQFRPTLQTEVARISAGVGLSKLHNTLSTAITAYVDEIPNAADGDVVRADKMPAELGHQAPSPWDILCFMKELVPTLDVLRPSPPLWSAAQFAAVEKAVLLDVGQTCPPVPPPARPGRSRTL